MDLATIKAALAAWVVALTALDPKLVLWENKPRPFVGPAYALLVLQSPVQVGRDQTVYNETANVGAELQPVQIGMRRFTLSIGFEAFSQGDEADGTFYAERARRRMGWAACRTILRDANIAVVSIASAVRADYKVDDRWISRVVMDVVMSATVDERDYPGLATEADLPTTYIETIGATSHLTRPDGTEPPAPPQFDDETIPPEA